MKLSRIFLAGAAALLLSQSAFANPVAISTIQGYYDKDEYDTPELDIINSSNFDFTNITITLTGYQPGTPTYGLTATTTIADIAANTTYDLVWNGGTPCTGSCVLFAYDYDDQFGNAAAGTPTGAACVQPYPYCAVVGNFYVTFTATWDGQAIYSQFSPSPTLIGAGNAAGTFVGWEGLDPTGLSETVYDDHQSDITGTLANIYAGTPPPVVVTATPEPSSLVLLGTGALSLAGMVRRRIASVRRS